MSQLLARWWDSDVGYSFRTSPTAISAALIAFVCVFCAVFANWIAPHNPFDLSTLELSDARLPPAWEAMGKSSSDGQIPFRPAVSTIIHDFSQPDNPGMP